MKGLDKLHGKEKRVMERFPQVSNAYEGMWKEFIQRQLILEERTNKLVDKFRTKKDNKNAPPFRLNTDEQCEFLQAAIRQRFWDILDAANGNRLGKHGRNYTTPEERAFENFEFIRHVRYELKSRYSKNNHAVRIKEEIEEILKEMGVLDEKGTMVIPEDIKQAGLNAPRRSRK